MAIKKGSPLLIIATAIIIVIIVSLLPLSKWSGGRIKDFSLFSDILKEVGVMEDVANPEEEIDPELVKAMKEAEERNPLTANDSVLSQPIDTIISAPKAPRQGGMVVIEDYTTDGVGLIQFRHAIETGSLARVAVVGDSYIEGDIFTQDLREKLQDAYGGAGVGYVSMHSDFPGFRKSVRQEERDGKLSWPIKSLTRAILTWRNSIPCRQVLPMPPTVAPTHSPTPHRGNVHVFFSFPHKIP